MKTKLQELQFIQQVIRRICDLNSISVDSLVVSVSRDATWCLNDLSRGVCHIQKSVDGNSDGYTCCQFHPDGLILATGTESGLVRLWDIREQQNVANCEGHTANIHSLSFNENGYMLATGGADGLAHVWDLRKIKSLTNFAGITSFFSLKSIHSSPKYTSDGCLL